MINGIDQDPIENKPFDKCSIKANILDTFYKGELFLSHEGS